MDVRIEQLNRVQQIVAEQEHVCQNLLLQQRKQEEAVKGAFDEQQTSLRANHGSIDKLQAYIERGFTEYVSFLREAIEKTRQRYQQEEIKLTRLRKELQQAMIKKRSLEILKDKAHERYQKEQAKEEERFLSELAQMRHIRQHQQSAQQKARSKKRSSQQRSLAFSV